MKITSAKSLDKGAVRDTSYVKLCVNKTHLGPVSKEKVEADKAATLTAAANKIRSMADFSVKFSNEKPSEENKTVTNKSYVLETESVNDLDIARDAVLLMQAWDSVTKSQDGTPDYLSKLEAMLQARGEAYQKLGITPGKGKISLTADQRTVYNSIVGPYGFDYYEYHVAFKMKGQSKFVRSKTYRSLRPLNLRSLIKNINDQCDKISKNIDIVVKTKN